MVAARLYDVDGATQRLIARGVQRPLGVGAGPTQQVFQLHPQAWTVQPGHVLKLELLAQDSQYLRTPDAAAAVDHVSATCSCGCRSSTRRAATSATASRVASPAAKFLPGGLQAGPRVRDRGDRRRRRHRPGDAVADAGCAGELRRLHAGRGARLHGVTTATVISTAGDAALTVADPSAAHRPPGQRHVLAAQPLLGRARRSRRP